MPGNLNVKKSWHPGILKNQAAVWQREQDAIAERKKILERQKEIQQERERNELLALQESATGKKRVQRMEWMYSGVSSGGKTQEDEETEEYLLGKRRIDKFSKGDEDGLERDVVAERFAIKKNDAVNGETSVVMTKDLTRKIQNDPMALIIQKQKLISLNKLKKKLPISKEIKERHTKSRIHKESHYQGKHNKSHTRKNIHRSKTKKETETETKQNDKEIGKERKPGKF